MHFNKYIPVDMKCVRDYILPEHLLILLENPFLFMGSLPHHCSQEKSLMLTKARSLTCSFKIQYHCLIRQHCHIPFCSFPQSCLVNHQSTHSFSSTDRREPVFTSTEMPVSVQSIKTRLFRLVFTIFEL